jgi:hypothetical protein
MPVEAICTGICLPSRLRPLSTNEAFILGTRGGRTCPALAKRAEEYSNAGMAEYGFFATDNKAFEIGGRVGYEDLSPFATILTRFQQFLRFLRFGG